LTLIQNEVIIVKDIMLVKRFIGQILIAILQYWG